MLGHKALTLTKTRTLGHKNWCQRLNTFPTGKSETGVCKALYIKSQVFAFCTGALETATAEACTGIARGPPAPQGDPEISRARQEQSA